MSVHIENRDILAHRILQLMERRRMNQDSLAAKAGLSQSLISKILSEKRGAIRSSTLKRIADALGTDMHNLTEIGQPTIVGDPPYERDTSDVEKTEKFTKHARKTVHAALENVEKWLNNKSLIGIPTGFDDLDHLLLGLENGKTIAVMGRPSLGKTTFVLNIIDHIAIEKQLAVGMISLDMTAESVILRLLCRRAKTDLRSFRKGFIAERDFPPLTRAASDIAIAPLYIDDSPGLTIDDIVARAKRLKLVYGIRILIIDYLQLVRAASRRSELNREVTASDISISLKALAKELMIPIVIVCSLPPSRENQRRAKPSDALDSSVIAQDADVVLILERSFDDDWDDGDNTADGFVEMNVTVWKHRDGPTGSISVRFDPSLGRFEDARKLTEDFQSDPEDINR